MIDALLERDLLPDTLIRFGIRRIVAGRLREQEAGGVDAQSQRFEALLDSSRGAAHRDHAGGSQRASTTRCRPRSSNTCSGRI